MKYQVKDNQTGAILTVDEGQLDSYGVKAPGGSQSPPPSSPTGGFQLPDQQQVESGVSGAMRTLGGGTMADTLGLARGASNAVRSAVGMDQQPNPFFTPEQKQQWQDNPVKAVGSSVLKDLSGAASLAMGPGKGILGRAAMGFGQGALNATSQEGSTPGSTMGGGAVGALINSIVGGGAAAIGSGEKLQGSAKSLMNQMTGSEIGDTQSWVQKGDAIAQSILEKTTGDGPREISQSIVSNLDATSKKITDYLKNTVGKKISIPLKNAVGSMEKRLNSYLSTSLSNPGILTDQKVVSAIFSINKIYEGVSKSMPGVLNREGKSSITGEQLFKAKREIGKRLDNFGVWSTIKNGGLNALSDSERVWLDSYKFTKDTLDQELEKLYGQGSGISKLTEEEHNLMMANSSLHGASKTPGSGRMSLRNPTSFLMNQSGALPVLKTKLARTEYAAGKGLEKLLGKSNVGDLINKLLTQGGSGYVGQDQSGGQ